MEVWRPVVGYETTHEVSNLGRVRNLGYVVKIGTRFRRVRRKILRGAPDSHGYRQVRIKGRLFQVHQLVAAAFIGPRPKNHDTCHNDGNPKNRRAGNLRYDTKRGNAADKRIHGTELLGEQKPQAKLTDSKVRDIFARAQAGEHPTHLAREFGVNHSTISVLLSGKTWTHITGGAAPHPEQRRQSKLTKEIIDRIRTKAADGVRNADLAREFELNSSTISRIKSGQSWGWCHA